MEIPLNEFEQTIDERIIERGFRYFHDGAVRSVSEIAPGEYTADISGTEDYYAQIIIKNNTVILHQCSCPYDMGPVCKHIVALLFYLQQDELSLNKPMFTSTKKKKSISANQQVKELLKLIPHDELINFVHQKGKEDNPFRNYFLATFGYLIEDESKDFYKKQIRAILKSVSGRGGWIDWSDMSYVASNTQLFLDNAENCLSNKRFDLVFYISTALLEEITQALQYVDDSNGDLGYFIDSSIELLIKLSQENIPDILKQEIFEYCISAFNQKLFEDWDWHLGMLHIASNLIEEESDAKIILDHLDAFKSGFNDEQAQFLKLDLLRKFKTEKEIKNYINKHISNPSIRQSEIENAFKNKDFTRVIQLSNDGIKCDEEQKPGLVTTWYNWLLKVAQAKNDTPRIIEYARLLLIDNFSAEQDYYQVLKNHIEDKNWHPFLEKLIREISPNNSRGYINLQHKIYIREGWWDRLFLMLKQNLSLEDIKRDEAYLSKDYSSELIDLYFQEIQLFLEQNVGRKYYRTACKFLRRMKKLGGNEQMMNLIDLLRQRYPKRTALMDELNKV